MSGSFSGKILSGQEHREMELIGKSSVMEKFNPTYRRHVRLGVVHAASSGPPGQIVGLHTFSISILFILNDRRDHLHLFFFCQTGRFIATCSSMFRRVLVPSYVTYVRAENSLSFGRIVYPFISIYSICFKHAKGYSVTTVLIHFRCLKTCLLR